MDKEETLCDFAEFLDNNSDDSFIDDADFEQISLRKKSCNSIVNQKMNMVLDTQIKNGFSHQATRNVIKLLNEQNDEMKLPQNRDAIKAYACEQIEYSLFVKCEKCDEIIQHDTKCLKCQSVMKIDSKKIIFLFIFNLNIKFAGF